MLSPPNSSSLSKGQIGSGSLTLDNKVLWQTEHSHVEPRVRAHLEVHLLFATDVCRTQNNCILGLEFALIFGLTVLRGAYF